MPIQVEAVKSLSDAMVRNQVERLYETSPEFSDGQDAVNQLDNVLDEDTVLYTAIFNDKIIGASVLVTIVYFKTSWCILPIVGVVSQIVWSVKCVVSKKSKACRPLVQDVVRFIAA
jgi:hypothetical protein